MKPEDFVQTAAFRAAGQALNVMVDLGRALVEHHRSDNGSDSTGIALACAFQLFIAEKITKDLAPFKGDVEPLLKLFREGFAYAEAVAHPPPAGKVH